MNPLDAKSLLREKLLQMKREIKRPKDQEQKKEVKIGINDINSQSKKNSKKQQDKQIEIIEQNSTISRAQKNQLRKAKKIIQLKQRKQKVLIETISFKKSQPVSEEIPPWRKQTQIIPSRVIPIRNLNEMPIKKISLKKQEPKKQIPLYFHPKDQQFTKKNNFFDYFPAFILNKKKKVIQLPDLKIHTLSQLVDLCHLQKIIHDEDYNLYCYHKGPTIQKNFLEKFANNNLNEFNFNKTKFTLLDHRRLSHILVKISPQKYRLGDRPFSIHPDIANFLQQIYKLPEEDYCTMCNKVDQKYNLKWLKEIMKKYDLFNKANLTTTTKEVINPPDHQNVCELLPTFNLNKIEKEDVTIKRSKEPNQIGNNCRKKQKLSKDSNDEISELNLIQEEKEGELINSKNKKNLNKTEISNDVKTKQKNVVNNNNSNNKRKNNIEDEDDMSLSDISKSNFSLGELGQITQNDGQEQIFQEDKEEALEDIKKSISHKRPTDEDLFSSINSEQSVDFDENKLSDNFSEQNAKEYSDQPKDKYFKSKVQTKKIKVLTKEDVKAKITNNKKSYRLCPK